MLLLGCYYVPMQSRLCAHDIVMASIECVRRHNSDQNRGASDPADVDCGGRPVSAAWVDGCSHGHPAKQQLDLGCRDDGLVAEWVPYRPVGRRFSSTDGDLGDGSHRRRSFPAEHLDAHRHHVPHGHKIALRASGRRTVRERRGGDGYHQTRCYCGSGAARNFRNPCSSRLSPHRPFRWGNIEISLRSNLMP